MRHAPSYSRYIYSVVETRQLQIAEVFKIIMQKYDPFAVPELLPSSYNATRGNIYKLLNHSFHSNLRKFYFTARVVNIWNSYQIMLLLRDV